MKLTTNDQTAADAADKAGIKSAAEISGGEIPTIEMVHARVQLLEALLSHIIAHHFRNVDPKTVLDEWLTNQAGGKIIDEHAKGRAGQ